MLPANVILLALHRSESGKAQVCEENPASHPAKLEILIATLESMIIAYKITVFSVNALILTSGCSTAPGSSTSLPSSAKKKKKKSIYEAAYVVSLDF